MTDGEDFNEDARTSPRFVPKERLSISLTDATTSLVHGDVKDLSELGVCVRADSSIASGGVVTINVRDGYSFLFRARARIVWGPEQRRDRELAEGTHGLRFTELSPFTRKLIRRLGGVETRPLSAPIDAPVVAETWGEVWDSDSDPDLEILFRPERSPADVDKDRLDVLSQSLPRARVDIVAPNVEAFAPPEPEDLTETTIPANVPPYDPELDAPVLDGVEAVEWSDASETALAPKLTDIQGARELTGNVELSGSLGYFDAADVLQMLESCRATGVLYIDDVHKGEIHLLEGCICRCVSSRLSDEEASFHLVVAKRGRFHFVPCPVPENAKRRRTTTQLVLEAHLRREHDEDF